MKFFDKQIQTTLKKFRIIIAGHKGKTDIREVQEYIDLLEKNGAEIFGSMYHVAQERLEAILRFVQPAAFNVFKFEDVMDYLCDEMNKYDRIFPDKGEVVDETRARLEGTIGQMYGFLCNYPDGEAYFEEAEQYLKKDVKHCKINSFCWNQGMGYLTSLYFKKGDFKNLVKSFLIETQSANTNEKEIYNLSKLDLFNSVENDFFLLHRLYVCALGARNNITIIGEEKLKNRLLQSASTSNYPIFLTAKWLGVIYGLKGDFESALALFNKAGDVGSGDFTIDVIKLPVKILINFCRKSLGKRSKFDIKHDLELLDNRVKGIGENLAKLGLEKYITYDASWDMYEIANLMPFYYS